jgi:hypothetical protein
MANYIYKTYVFYNINIYELPNISTLIDTENIFRQEISFTNQLNDLKSIILAVYWQSSSGRSILFAASLCTPPLNIVNCSDSTCTTKLLNCSTVL